MFDLDLVESAIAGTTQWKHQSVMAKELAKGFLDLRARSLPKTKVRKDDFISSAIFHYMISLYRVVLLTIFLSWYRA